ncbi:hypothetical protein TWF694_002711 [Orbilia ellipsospora]|uniref:GLEYA adhesin domain-containing protein n=1 Tax=Orbilia ellipsospora TaxID=2528407 RepID=A0AAV9X426_9PEZI
MRRTIIVSATITLPTTRTLILQSNSTEISTVTSTSVATLTSTKSVTATATATTKTESSITDTERSTRIITLTSTIIEIVNQTDTSTLLIELSTIDTVIEKFTVTESSSVTTIITQTSEFYETQTTTVTDPQTTILTTFSTLVTTSPTAIDLASASVQQVNKHKRQDANIPKYAAGVCPDESAYISGCNCLGVSTGSTLYYYIPTILINYILTNTVTFTQFVSQFTTTILTADAGTVIFTTTINSNIIFTSTYIQTITPTSKKTISTTLTLIDDSTRISSAESLVTKTFTQTTTRISTILANTTKTSMITFISTVVSTVGVTETDTQDLTMTATSTSVTTVTVNATTTTTIIPIYTQFAIQVTNDTANGAFKGQYMYFYDDLAQGNASQVAFTSNYSLASYYASDGNGNVTAQNTDVGPGVYGVPFAVYNTSATNNGLYEMPLNAELEQVGCWIDSGLIFRCEGAGRKFMGVDNSTSRFNIYSDVANIFTGGATGPLVLKAVSFPTAAPGPIPPAAAKQLIIQNTAVYGDGVYRWQDNYLTTILEGVSPGTAGPYRRLIMDANQTNAKVFLADPATGNIFDTTNDPFLYNYYGTNTGSNLYTLFKENSINTILGCTVNYSSLAVTCFEAGFQYTGVYTVNQGANTGEVGIFSNVAATSNVAYIMSLMAIFL